MNIWIDQWLFDHVFQPLSEWFEKVTGRNTFFFARVAMWASLFLYVVSPYRTKSSVLSIVIVVAGTILSLGISYWAEYRCVNRPERTMNYFRADGFMSSIRFIQLFLCVFGIMLAILVYLTPLETFFGFLWRMITHALDISFWYLIACTPKPPIRDFSHSLVSGKV